MSFTISVDSAEVRAVLATYLRDEGEEVDGEAHRIAARHQVLPLYLDWVGVVTLSSSGELGFVAWEAPDTLEQLLPADRRMIQAVRAVGATRFPSVHGLRPARTATSRTCPTCGGTGRPISEGRPVPDNLTCQCGGLGWIEPDSSPSE